VIGALRKFLSVLLVCFGHLLRLHLELLLGLLGYVDSRFAIPYDAGA
jgi:hypothetical protein